MLAPGRYFDRAVAEGVGDSKPEGGVREFIDSVVATGSRRFSRQALTRPRWVAGSPLLIRAYALAADAYRGRRRASDESPLLAHAIEVAELLRAAGRDQALVAAALLHDGVEHGTLDEAQAQLEIGEPVTGLGPRPGARLHDLLRSPIARRRSASGWTRGRPGRVAAGGRHALQRPGAAPGPRGRSRRARGAPRHHGRGRHRPLPRLGRDDRAVRPRLGLPRPAALRARRADPLDPAGA